MTIGCPSPGAAGAVETTIVTTRGVSGATKLGASELLPPTPVKSSGHDC